MDDDLFDLVTMRQPMTISFPFFKNQTMNGLMPLFLKRLRQVLLRD